MLCIIKTKTAFYTPRGIELFPEKSVDTEYPGF